MDKDEDEPDEGDQHSQDGQADDKGDGGSDDEDDSDDDDSKDESDEEDSDDEDDLDDDLDESDRSGRNADKAISKKDAEEVVPALKSIVKIMVKHPDDAEETLNELREEQPALAKRLARMYESGKNKELNAALKDAPDGLKDLLSQLVDDMASVKSRSEQDQIKEERRIYKNWENESHQYLDPKSESAQTAVGKKLIKEFRAAINRLPVGEPVTEDLLEDALAIAERRSGWNNSRVSEQAKKQAKEQADKARSGAIGSGKGKSGKKGDQKQAPSRITSLWPNQTEDRQKKVDEAKSKKFPNG
ncbi:hypothetical protein KW797_00080 [Candidatus Parcubacteria bacterium]|nr:hypothetical protein [Candidatus Parcubacteria bacterium]